MITQLPTSVSQPTAGILEHIRALSETIGPRGSTTEGEKRGAQYCKTEFERLQLQPHWESFSSAKSIFLPHRLACIFYLVAFALYPWSGRVTAALAALVSAVTLASELMELGFLNNLIRFVLPKGESQNVFTCIPPAGEHRQDLVLIGHLDTQRTPLFFRTPRWVSIYQNFTTVAFILFSLQVVLYVIGAAAGWGWIWPATIPSAICALVLGAFLIEADHTPFTAGANDNASAVGMVLTLAKDFSEQPLLHTRVYCVCTGCEEVQHYGATDFFKRHRSEMRSPRGLVFELLGCAGPGWMTQEGIIVPFYSDPSMVQHAERLSAAHPEWGAYAVKISGGNSELADCKRFGVPAMTFFGLKPDGEAPYWHQVGDTFDKINPQVLEHTYEMTRELIRVIDEG
jgi:hypothetical protein